MLMYTELHARSAFSFLEGASLPEELAERCAERGMAAMGLLDRDGVYGAPRFYLAAKKISVRAHIGAEVTSAAGWRFPLLVETRVGYQNLCRLITRMKLRARKGEGQVSDEEVGERAAGLICLTGGKEGPLAHALARGGVENGLACVRQLCEIFGREMCTWNCSGILIAPRKRAITRQWKSRGNCVCRCWRRTACATRSRSGAKCWMCLPACVITAPSKPRGGCWGAIPNDI